MKKTKGKRSGTMKHEEKSSLEIVEKRYTVQELRQMMKGARHPAEIPLTILSVLFTLITFAAISYASVFARSSESAMEFLKEMVELDEETIQFILRFGGDIVAILVVVLILRIVYENLTFLGKVVSRDMRAEDSRVEELSRHFQSRARELGIRNLPELFITGSDYETKVLGVDIRGKNAVTISKAMIAEAEKNGDWNDVEYAVSRRIAHIFLGHYDLWFQLSTLVGKMIPVYRELFSRAMTYSTDRVVSVMMGKEDALYAMFTSCYDVDMYKDMEIPEIVESKVKDHTRAERLSKAGANLMSDEPIMPYRLLAIIDRSRPGRLL